MLGVDRGFLGWEGVTDSAYDGKEPGVASVETDQHCSVWGGQGSHSPRGAWRALKGKARCQPKERLDFYKRG